MVNRARLLLASATIASACCACVAVFGMDPLSEKAAAEDGGIDAGVPDADANAAEPDPGTCGPDDIGEVGKPAASPSQGDGGSVHFAFTLLDLGMNGNAERPGFDLDGRVTTGADTSSCVLHGSGADALQFGADTPSGVDNVAFGLLQALRSLYVAFDPVQINARLVNNVYGVVVRLDGWNGTSDDDEVNVLVFPTIGFWVPADGGLAVADERRAVFNPDAGHLHAPDGRFRIGTIGSSIFSSAAWINGGKLVARFSTMTLPLRSSLSELLSFDITMQDAWITATIAPEAGTLSDGKIGGRMPSGAFLEQVRLMYDDSAHVHVCGLVQRNLGLLCSVRDIRLSHCDDGKAAPCDALSFGARFEAARIGKLGPHRERTDDEYRAAGQVPPSERCADEPDSGPVDCPPER